MKEFLDLLNTTDRLFGPNGCPWDQKQTLKSCRPYIVEESNELIDAIDSEDNAHILEELGDLFFVALFVCKVAEKEGHCQFKDVLQLLNEKMIRRHPHVFGEAKIDTMDELVQQWGQIKQAEKKQRKSSLDGIPKGLPALARAQKVYKKLQKSKFTDLPKKASAKKLETEDDLGAKLWEIVSEAQEKGLDAEHALRKVLVGLESRFREFEQST